MAVKAKRVTRRMLLWQRSGRRSLRPFILPATVCLVIAAFYHAWLKTGFVTAGDFPYFTVSHLLDAVPFPSLWESSSSTGGYNILSAPAFPLALLQGIMASFRIDWSMSERLLWIIPAVFLPSASTYALSLAWFRQHLAAFVSALAVVMNSYVYLLYEGGQFGVAVAYGCIPLILWGFVRGQRRGTIQGFAFTGIFMAIQAMYDIRSTYITVGVLALYGLVCCSRLQVRHTDSCAVPSMPLLNIVWIAHIVVALGTLAVLNLWWILPAFFVHAPQLPSGYVDVVGVHALSHMTLSNSIALFHPFWFANDLRIASINPLFFITPLLFFGLLLRRSSERVVLFLVVVALVAAFLVKGDNDPAGGVYDWLFMHLPGFSFFRDPSKFYQPLAFAYALLLGVAAGRLQHIIGDRTVSRRLLLSASTTVFIGLAVFPAYPALAQRAQGAFVVNSVPSDYARFNKYIDHQHDFFRILWIPARPRFGTFSTLHPGLDATALSNCCIKTMSNTNQPWSWLRSPQAVRTLQELSIHYVVVPTGTVASDFIGQPTVIADTPSSISLAATRTLFVNQREQTIGRLHIFSNASAYPSLFATHDARHVSSGAACTFGAICIGGFSSVPHIEASPEAVQMTLLSYSAGASCDMRIYTTKAPTYLVLQQTYDPHWLAFIEPAQEPFHWWMLLLHKPLPTVDRVVANGYANAWIIRKPGAYHVVVEYWPQQLVLVGLVLDAIVLLVSARLMIIHRRKQKRVLSFSFGANL